MLIKEALNIQAMNTWTVERLTKFELTEENLKEFFDICQSVFYATLLQEGAYLKYANREELFEVNLSGLANATVPANGDIIRYAEATPMQKRLCAGRPPIVFAFTVVGTATDGSRRHRGVVAEAILSGMVSVVDANGNANTALLEKLRRINYLCRLAATDVNRFLNVENDEAAAAARAAAAEERHARAAERRAEQEARRQRRADHDAAVAAAQADLGAAEEAGDIEAAEAAQARLDDLNANRIRVRELADRAEEQVTEVLSEDDAKASARSVGVPDDRDSMESFICGWLAANVVNQFAYVPYTVSNKGLRSRRYLNSLFNAFGNGVPARTSKAEARELGGYCLTPFWNKDLPEKERENRSANGVNQMYIALHTRFRNRAVTNAPAFVRSWLANHPSTKYDIDEARVQGTIQSRSLVSHLFSDYGFALGPADQSAINRCRARATDGDLFDYGFNWPAGKRAPLSAPPATTNAATADDMPENELDIDFPEVEMPTASDYDADYTN